MTGAAGSHDAFEWTSRRPSVLLAAAQDNDAATSLRVTLVEVGADVSYDLLGSETPAPPAAGSEGGTAAAATLRRIQLSARGMLGGAAYAVAEDVSELKSLLARGFARRARLAAASGASAGGARAHGAPNVAAAHRQGGRRRGRGGAPARPPHHRRARRPDLIRVGSPEPGGAGPTGAELRGHAEVSRSLEALGTVLREGAAGGRPAWRDADWARCCKIGCRARPRRGRCAFTRTRATVRRQLDAALRQGADAAAAEAEAAAGGRRRRGHRFRRFVADRPARRPVAGDRATEELEMGGAAARGAAGHEAAMGVQREKLAGVEKELAATRNELAAHREKHAAQLRSATEQLRAAQAREEAAAAAAASRVAELRERLHASEMERSRVEGESAHNTAKAEAQNMAVEGRLAATAAALQEERAAVETERKRCDRCAQLDNAKADTRQQAATAAAAVQRGASVGELEAVEVRRLETANALEALKGEMSTATAAQETLKRQLAEATASKAEEDAEKQRIRVTFEKQAAAIDDERRRHGTEVASLNSRLLDEQRASAQLAAELRVAREAVVAAAAAEQKLADAQRQLSLAATRHDALLQTEALGRQRQEAVAGAAADERTAPAAALRVPCDAAAVASGGVGADGGGGGSALGARHRDRRHGGAAARCTKRLRRCDGQPSSVRGRWRGCGKRSGTRAMRRSPRGRPSCSRRARRRRRARRTSRRAGEGGGAAGGAHRVARGSRAARARPRVGAAAAGHPTRVAPRRPRHPPPL